jgi:hypothetical protein
MKIIFCLCLAVIMLRRIPSINIKFVWSWIGTSACHTGLFGRPEKAGLYKTNYAHLRPSRSVKINLTRHQLLVERTSILCGCQRTSIRHHSCSWLPSRECVIWCGSSWLMWRGRQPSMADFHAYGDGRHSPRQTRFADWSIALTNLLL